MDLTTELSDYADRATREPAATWSALLTAVGDEISDADLAMITVEVLDTIRVYGSESLWLDIRAARVHHQLTRAVAALDRYDKKYDVFSRLLNGEYASDATEEMSPDLPLPNPFQRDSPPQERTQTLTAEERAAFLVNDHDAWQRVQDLIEDSPREACQLAYALIAECDESQLSTIGIALLEELITVREAEVRDYVLDRVRHNARFRAALSHAYLNPSETFLDELIDAARTTRTG